jgi:galactoside O-acetyltransferase
MTNPTIPAKFTGVTHGKVFIGRHVIVGCNSVILPNIALADGVAIGALSLVNKDCAAFSIYSGHPAKRIKERSRNLLVLEQAFLAANPSNSF